MVVYAGSSTDFWTSSKRKIESDFKDGRISRFCFVISFQWPFTLVAGPILGPSRSEKSESDFKDGHIFRFCFVFQVIQVISSGKFWLLTVGTIDIGTNPSEPTGECGLGNRENPSEPTTPFPSPQYRKAEANEINNTYCWLNFSDFSSGATRYDWL